MQTRQQNRRSRIFQFRSIPVNHNSKWKRILTHQMICSEKNQYYLANNVSSILWTTLNRFSNSSIQASLPIETASPIQSCSRLSREIEDKRSEKSRNLDIPHHYNTSLEARSWSQDNPIPESSGRSGVAKGHKKKAMDQRLFKRKFMDSLVIDEVMLYTKEIGRLTVIIWGISFDLAT